MNRKQSVFGLCLFAIVLVLGSLLYAHKVAAQRSDAPIVDQIIPSRAAMPSGTIVGGNITTDTTWTKAGSPYTATSDVTIVAGATLTVEPGVEVRFDQYRTLWVQGTLLAMGTAAQPITFTAASAAPTPGWWSGLYVYESTASARLDYATVAYGGYDLSGNVQLFSSSVVTLTHNIIRNGSQGGVYASSGAVAHLSDSRIADNAGYALEYADGSVDPQLSNLTITGNGTDAVVFGNGSLIGARVWKNLGVPYIMTGDQTVESGATLTVEPGVEVRFDQYRTLWVQGTLLAMGTPAQPITFTAASATPTPGWWSGLYVYESTASARLDYATVAYGGYDLSGNVQLDSNSVATLTHSVIRNGSQDGVYASSGAVAHISDSRIADNAGYALEYADGSVNPQLSNLTITGNGTDAVVFGNGSLIGARMWKNLGVPYIMTGDQTVESGATLTVEPGVEVRFDQYRTLWVNGTLLAMGTPAQPITFTAASTTPMPGWWAGLYVYGSTASARLDHVTVAYGGYDLSGSVQLYDNGQAAISHSKLIHSSSAGLYAASGGTGVSIEFSQIVSNTGYGVWNNDPEDVLMAVNNWWGSASGPTADGTCNPGGTGSSVSAGVAYRPFLNAPDATPLPLTPREVYVLQASPLRWYVPADGYSPVWISITMRTGAGLPAPNRAVHVSTSLGDIAESNLTTNAAGQAFTYLTSSITGVATVTVTSGSSPDSCTDWAIPAYTQVSFTTAEDSPLMPDGEAPYMNNDIEVEPEPLIQGVPSTITLRLTNPFSSPITVNGTLGYLQFGIGQLLGSVKEVSEWEIPANSEAVLSVPWTPPLSGHYCLEFQYWYTDGVSSLEVMGGRSGRSQRNLSVQQASNNSRGDKGILDRARKAIGWIDRLFGGRAKGLDIPRKGAQVITNWNLDMAETIGKEMGGDPPRQDYTIIAEPNKPTVSLLQPGSDVSPAMAVAYNAFVDAQLDVNAFGQAILISYDRSGGASEAGEYDWVNQQTAAVLYYQKQMGQALLDAADAVDDLHNALIAAGYADIVQTADEVRAYQNQLSTQGFTQDEIDAAHLLGLSDADIEASRQAIIAANPDEEAGSMWEYHQNLAASYREWGNAFVNAYNFPQQVPGSNMARATASGDNNLAQFFQSAYSLQVRNPLSETATVELSVRRVDIPNDWIVSTDWVSATLAAGQQLTATVTIIPASASVQGTQPKVAVEGYIGDQLIGGVVLSVVVPEHVLFLPHHIYLPLVIRH